MAGVALFAFVSLFATHAGGFALATRVLGLDARLALAAIVLSGLACSVAILLGLRQAMRRRAIGQGPIEVPLTRLIVGFGAAGVLSFAGLALLARGQLWAGTALAVVAAWVARVTHRQTATWRKAVLGRPEGPGPAED